MTDTIRIAVIDDHPMMRNGIAHTLGCEPDMDVIAEGESCDEAIQIAQDHAPDVVLLDISMPGGGIEAARAIAHACPVVKIVMLTVSEDEEDVANALSAGAHGYVLKGVSGPELTRNVRNIYNGDDYRSPNLAARLLAYIKTDTKAHSDDLNPFSLLNAREEQILKLVAKGMSNKEVGCKLELSEKTIKNYMTNILQKLQVRNRVEATLLAQGIAVSLGPDTE